MKIEVKLLIDTEKKQMEITSTNFDEALNAVNNASIALIRIIGTAYGNKVAAETLRKTIKQLEAGFVKENYIITKNESANKS